MKKSEMRKEITRLRAHVERLEGVERDYFKNLDALSHLVHERDDARTEADRLGDRCAELEGVVDEVCGERDAARREAADLRAWARDADRDLAAAARRAQDANSRANAEAEQARRYSELLAQNEKKLAAVHRELQEEREQTLVYSAAARAAVASSKEWCSEALADVAEAGRLNARVSELEAQVAELLPWARQGAFLLTGARHYGTNPSWELLERIEAGEFGEVA